mmetsp:Transcript_19484/g.55843  ORF Transcript_19484/g.55843 Transcript_19484/m.55843 type:complete len:102 (+) Transcript_19484:360-665(+)
MRDHSVSSRSAISPGNHQMSTWFCSPGQGAPVSCAVVTGSALCERSLEQRCRSDAVKDTRWYGRMCSAHKDVAAVHFWSHSSLELASLSDINGSQGRIPIL